MRFDDYTQFDAIGLAGLVAAREVAAADVLEAAIDAIERLNPELNAVVTPMFDQARSSIVSGPFAGVPYLVKDLNTNIAGVRSANGSRLLRDNVAKSDSTLITRLRDAGLVLVGKTNTPEFGLNVCTSPAEFGATRNPHDQSRSAGGSSGGSACAVASGMLPAAHATDSGGSIRIPASNCGLFGLKPTRSLVPLGNDSVEGLGGMSTGHAVTHSVRDSALLLRLTSGGLPGDSYAPPAQRPIPNRYRIAVWTEGFADESVSPECVAAVSAAADLCESLGMAVEVVRPPVDGSALRSAFDVLFTANIAAALDVVDDEEAIVQGVEPATYACRTAAKRYSAVDYVAAVAAMRATATALGTFFDTYDALLTPTLANPPLLLGDLSMQTDDWDAYVTRMLDEIPFTPLFNGTGGAAMSVPLGRSSDGLPIGVQFGSDLGSDEMLLDLAAQLEEAAPWHDRR